MLSSQWRISFPQCVHWHQATDIMSSASFMKTPLGLSLMEKNCSMMTEFTQLRISHTEGLDTILFVLFLAFYACTLLGNVSVLMAVLSSTRLHTLMYFFLGNLSVFDMSFSSVTCPKMLLYLMGLSPLISYKNCVLQLFFHFLGSTECLLYTVMAYDRFAAICYPLRYTAIMNPRICGGPGCGHMAVRVYLFQHLDFSHLHFAILRSQWSGSVLFDIPALLPLACADTSSAQRVTFTNVGLVSLLCCLLILLFHTPITISILCILSTEGHLRAFPLAVPTSSPSFVSMGPSSPSICSPLWTPCWELWFKFWWIWLDQCWTL